jgi:hypothetical protein
MSRRRAVRRELRLEELEAIVARAAAVLSVEERGTLLAAIETLGILTRELEAKGASIARLRRLLFGAPTEKTSRVVGETARDGPDAREATASGAAPSGAGATDPGATDGAGPARRPGHGRNGTSAYRGAARVRVPHGVLHHGDRCPECARGKVYAQRAPEVLIRVIGMAPLHATLYALERLRCNACGEVFAADPPPGVGPEKYDETAASMIGLLKYGCGLPFHRLERLQRDLGIPLPAPTQWELVRDAAERLAPAHDELIRQAAQGEVVHNDDTAMTVLALTGSRPHAGAAEETAAEERVGKERTGVYTSGIVATAEGHQIALFFTGRRHAGENLATVLQQRAAELPPPIQMCDALAVNTAGELDTIVANCLAHGRRQFVDVAQNFPDECRYVLETLREVYRTDATARARQLSAAERLRLHQAESGPRMEALEQWLRHQFDARLIEPNSGLGEAIAYMQNHWAKLTLFLREPGAPLDNNVCERALKKAILHRKNALFYKTENGSRVGDLFMSLIHTAELCRADAFDFLTALQRHHEALAAHPEQWMPWNYTETLARVAGAPQPSA